MGLRNETCRALFFLGDAVARWLTWERAASHSASFILSSGNKTEVIIRGKSKGNNSIAKSSRLVLAIIGSGISR